MRTLLGPDASEAEVDAATHLSMGAVMEAALVCATADEPAARARERVDALKRMLAVLRR